MTSCHFTRSQHYGIYRATAKLSIVTHWPLHCIAARSVLRHEYSFLFQNSHFLQQAQANSCNESSFICLLLERVCLFGQPQAESIGSVARGKVLQSLQYLGRNHSLQLGHILFRQQLGLANYLARISAIYNRFISELIQTSFAVFGMLK